ncbi:hypothetical protein [Schaalia sp. ZJ1691]|uniref:hypothetical protein n=1 Tax=Schaalia sp. ZJ1691 TaxID=2709404 RepID=UPI0013ED9382|nr:hypothetical protein [Schaalia sp. ZJ1691]
MAIDAVVNPDLNVLRAASQRKDVREAIDKGHVKLAELRFHEGLRRRWEEARAEAGVREATALAMCEGIRITVDDLRLLSMTPNGESPDHVADENGMTEGERQGSRHLDPAHALAVGIWRSQWNLASSFDPMNTRTPVRRTPRPLAALIATIHRDITSKLVEEGHVDARLSAIPQDSHAISYAMNLLHADLSALACAAGLIAHFRIRDVFTPASAAVGAALARWVLVSRGIDPSGVAVLTAADALDQAQASRALAGWVMGDEDGLARWLIHVAQSVEYGCDVGIDIARHIQAGKLSASS